ncbi:MAG: methyltransferase [Deltaproteobacteria bacterium]|nr:MAG: methyltransferase [Deltaproteobacteria bacterium]
MFSLDLFRKKYKTDSTKVKILDQRFSFFIPRELEPYLDQNDVFHNFPLWAKIWEPSVVLADHLASLTPNGGKNLLEIGCGLGLVGIVAAAFGHKVTMTEQNSDALNFARANALTNLSPSSPPIDIRRLDWNHPDLDDMFDLIVGSEVVYSQKDYDPLFRLFKKLLKSDGEIILAESFRESSFNFFKEMSHSFEVKAQKKIIRTPEKEIRIMLCSMKFK